MNPKNPQAAGEGVLAAAKKMRGNYVAGCLVGTCVEPDWDKCGPGEQLHWVLQASRQQAPAPANAVTVDDAKDAARYRWLRDQSGDPKTQPYIGIDNGDNYGAGAWLSGHEADAAIDAAIDAGGEESPK